jgi:hypothetical protein
MATRCAARREGLIDAKTIVPYARGVLHCITRAITVLALSGAIGLQWLALQSIAWTSMIIDYSKRGTLCHAIAQTFDGAHPCSLCRVVNKANSSENKTDLQVLTPKVDMICTKGRAITLFRPFVNFEYSTSNCFLSEIAHSPPIPPPRAFAS